MGLATQSALWIADLRSGTAPDLALLSDQEPATAQSWPTAQPQINIVAPDRGGYAVATAKALPAAAQVADRWHLMENASRAFVKTVHKSMRQMRAAVGTSTINPDLLTVAAGSQCEGYLHREETNVAIPALARRAVGGWAAQWRRALVWLGQQGLGGSLRVVMEWATRRGRAETARVAS